MDKKDDTPKEEIKSLPKLIEMVERLEKANAESREILSRQEELAARNLLGGKTDAGIQPPKPVEVTPKEYAEALRKGIILK